MLPLSAPGKSRFHYVGVAGTGMSALAQYQAMKGGRAGGSDRSLDPDTAAAFENLGIRCFPQDGSGVAAGVDAVVRSTAVEDGNPDLQKAAGLGIPVLHRSAVLAGWADACRTVAVAGTSGKSTVAAMVYEILAHAGMSPSLLTGGRLVSLQEKGMLGNACAGSSDILVIEADESDGTLVEYRPQVGVILNVEKDHKEVADLLGLFEGFHAKSRCRVVNADQPALRGLLEGAVSFGRRGDFALSDVRLQAAGSEFKVNGAPFRLSHPGLYNAENALAAAAATSCLGVGLDVSAAALAGFKGVARRFQIVGTRNGVVVIDDFAHNAVKVEAAMGAAQLRAGRVVAVFQLHGYGPARFLKDDLVEAFATVLRAGDVLLMPEIYYAGGTVIRDISSADIAGAVAARGRTARFFADREGISAWVGANARPGDAVLVMGARDPSLPAFARRILDALPGERKTSIVDGVLRFTQEEIIGRFRAERDNLVAAFCREANETQLALDVLWRLSLGDEVSGREKEMAVDQLKYLARWVPALAVFSLPGGMVLLPILAKVLPFNLLPVKPRKGV